MPSVTLLKFLHVPKLTWRNAHLWIAFFQVFRQSSYYAVFTEPTLRPSFPPFSIYRFRPDCNRNEILSRSNCAQVESLAIIILLWLATNRLKILDNVFDTVTKCLHRGFRYGYRRYKDNTFTLRTALFGRKSMILRSDLTLLNIKMSKNSTFAWFFLLKSLYYQWLFVSLQQQNPPRFPFEQRTRAGLLLLWEH